MAAWDALIGEELSSRLDAARREVVDKPLAMIVEGAADEMTRNRIWKRLDRHLPTWIRRQAAKISNRNAGLLKSCEVGEGLSMLEPELDEAAGRLRPALVQMTLVRAVVEQSNREAKHRLWEELTPQVRALAARFRKSALTRGFDDNDLFQDAWTHFDAKIGQFKLDHPKKAMVRTWFETVLTKRFLDVVKPRMADGAKRGFGEAASEDSDAASINAAHAVQAVRVHRAREAHRDELQHIREICTILLREERVTFAKVLAFQWWLEYRMTYDEIVAALSNMGKQYSRTWVYNSVREVKNLIGERYGGEAATAPADPE